MASILSGVDFNASTDFVYTKAKVNASGGKQVGILNKQNMKTLYMSTPLMLTWGVNEYTDEKTGKVTYDMALQFPNEEYNSPECAAFLKNIQELETRVKNDAIANSKEWLNKSKLGAEAVDALWTPMLKYPKDKATEEPDYSRPPTLKLKIPYWEGEFKNVELYNESKALVFPNEEDVHISNFIVKGSNVATIIQCGGVWVANGKFGVTWKLFQAVVKPRATLSGKCHINLSDKDKEKMAASVNDDNEDHLVQPVTSVTEVADSDDEEEVPVVEKAEAEVKEEIKAKQVAVEDQPKKKRVVKKKSSDE